MATKKKSNKRLWAGLAAVVVASTVFRQEAKGLYDDFIKNLKAEYEDAKKHVNKETKKTKEKEVK